MTESTTPLFFTLISLAAVAVLFGPRRALLPVFLFFSVLLSMDFHIYILGLNFFTIRILLVVAWVRILLRGEYHGLQTGPLDRAFVLFSVWAVIAETLQRGTSGFVYSAANNLFDGLGIYFLARVFLRDALDLRRVMACLVVLCCILGASMLAENITRHNWLTPLGAVMTQVQERAGRMRCQATFLHPVLAGTFGAVLLPLFAALWWQQGFTKRWAIFGCLAASIMTLTAGSGGPFMTYAAVLLGLALWPFRRRLKPILWIVLLGLLGLHLVMKAPVWALIARIPLVKGASGYHRYELIDEFIRHIGDWWCVGVQSTGDWGWLTDDVANGYCIIAKHGGLLALLLFFRVLVVAFRELARARAAAEGSHDTELFIWAFGVSLFGHLVSLFGTSYFDQTRVLWFLTLAMVPTACLLKQHDEQVLRAQTHEDSQALGNPAVALGISLGPQG